MSGKTTAEADQLKDTIEAAIDEAVERGVNPILWELREIADIFHQAADRLIDEQRRLDFMKAELARDLRKPNGQGASC